MAGGNEQNDEHSVYDIFQEPEDFYQPEKEPTTAEHTLLSGQTLKVRLVGHNPLWGHYLWNAGRTLATYLEAHSKILVKNRTVLELGAGGGLPSLVAAVKGASSVVVTDYPDSELIENLAFNINVNDLAQKNIYAEGYLWGAPVHKLFASLFSRQGIVEQSKAEQNNSRDQAGFDTLLLGDLLFNHSEHTKLIDTVRMAMKPSPDSVALVFFTPYRPWLLEKDLSFFHLAREAGFGVEKIFEEVMDKVMFEEDPGDELLRRTVYGYELRWRS